MPLIHSEPREPSQLCSAMLAFPSQTGSKVSSKCVELVDGRLIAGNNLAGSRLLLDHILRGWSVDAAAAVVLFVALIIRRTHCSLTTGNRANVLRFSGEPREQLCYKSGLPSRAVWRLQRCVGPPGIEILQSNTEAFLQRQARLGDLPQELRMVLDPVIEPVVLRFESDQNTRGSAVPRDDDFFTSR